MLLITKDVVKNILFQYLSYVDVMALRFTCKYLHNVDPPHFRDIVEKRLQEVLYPKNIKSCKENVIEKRSVFCDKLYEYGSIMSGSFILDCLYNTNHHNDIDIYDPADPEKSYSLRGQFDYTQDNEYHYGDPYLKFAQYLYKCAFHPAHLTQGYCIPAGAIRKYLPREMGDIDIDTYKNMVQIIPIGLIGKNIIPKVIYASYDLDICKSFFDGKKLYVRSWRKLIGKYDYIKPNTRFLMSIYIPDSETERHETMRRKKKYENKGFKIKQHPDWNLIEAEIDIALKTGKYMIGETLCDKIKFIEDGSINLDKYYEE